MAQLCTTMPMERQLISGRRTSPQGKGIEVRNMKEVP
jgi:hypothetical protein